MELKSCNLLVCPCKAPAWLAKRNIKFSAEKNCLCSISLKDHHSGKISFITRVKNKTKMEAFAYTLNKKLQLKRIKESHCTQIPGIPSQESTSLTVGVLHPTFLT